MPGGTLRLLLCTDLDRTLIPNGPQPESPGARALFGALAARPEITLVYVSDRPRPQVDEAIATYRLPLPDFVVGDLGTSLFRVGPERAWRHLESWEERIAEDWRGLKHEDLLQLLKGLPALRLRERHRQGRLKLGYYLPLCQDIDTLSALIRERLDRAGVSARLAWSVDDVSDVGLLDVLPARASQLSAIGELMRREGFSHVDTVFCGDSGNDLETLVSPIPAVLVANSRPEVQRLAHELSREAGTEDSLYIARGDFNGLNGNYSAGILEGLAHFHPAARGWLDGAVEAGARSRSDGLQ